SRSRRRPPDWERCGRDCGDRARAQDACSARLLRRLPGRALSPRSFACAGRGPPIFIARKFVECRAEILRLAEIAIDGGKSHIGNVVKFAQMLHDDLADCFRGNLALALALQLADDFRNHLLDPLRLDRTLAQRNLYGAHQLVAIERNAPAGTLDDGQFAQLHALERRETEIAGETDT